MSTWTDQIERDLSWREAEMGVLKLLVASSTRGSDRERALLRAGCAMLYAHYEGFCKFCWTMLLETIGRESVARERLIAAVARRSMAPAFRSIRGNWSDDNLWEFGSAGFQRELKALVTHFEEIDTEANLWPSLAREINESTGLWCQSLETHDGELRQLVGRRNNIAHGQKLEIADSAQLNQLEHAALLVMHELAIAVVDCLDQKTYLRPHGVVGAS